MEYKAFSEKHKIPTTNVWYYISDEDGKKIPIGEKNNLTLEEVIKQKDVIPPKKYSIIHKKPHYLSPSEENSLRLVKSSFLKHTDNIYCLDIDELCISSMEDFMTFDDTFKDCSWTKGNTKGVHIFMRITGLPEYKEQKQIIKNNSFNADLLRVNNVWDIPSKLVYNGEIMKEFEWKDIQHIFDVEKMNFKKIKSNPQTPTDIKEFTVDDNDKMKYIELLQDIGNPLNPDGSYMIERNDWLKIGAFLKSNGYPMEAFQQYTEIVDPIADVSDTWESLNRKVDYRAIYNLAKRINPTAYAKWLGKYKIVKFSSACLAKYFKLLYSDKFVVVNTVLYYYNGVLWEKSDKNDGELARFINDIFIPDLWKYYIDNIKENSNCKLDIEEIRAFPRNIENLHNTQIRKHLISDIYIFLSDNTVEFDTNPYLFAFKNGVYDLNLEDFITPRPEDYISINTGYNYVSSTPQQQTFLKKLIDSIFPDENMKEEYMMMLSTGLSGIQVEKLFIALGSGRNGKGVLNTLMMSLTGNYGYRMPVSCLLQEIKAGPNPELANLHNKRFVICSEPSQDKRINSESMKTITGEKTLPVRGLYQTDLTCVMRNTTVMESNREPRLTGSDYAELSRIRPALFTSTFYDETNYNSLPDDMKATALRENTYYKSDAFMNEYKSVLFDLIVPYFTKFKDNKYTLKPMPAECEKLCKKYVALSDDIYEWFSNYFTNVNIEIDKSEPIKLTDIYNIFHHSELFENFTKADKRKYNRKYFVDKLEKNMFLKKYIRIKDKHYHIYPNGEKNQIKSDCIVGWIKRVDDVEE